MRELNEKELSQVSGGKITEEFVAATNPGGGTPPGQQDPTLPNGNWDVETENQNPTGKAPPGQN
jgi:bacteriocin-like protein